MTPRPRSPAIRPRPALLAAALAVLAGPLEGQIPPAASTAWDAVVAEWKDSTFLGDIGASLALVVDGELARLETSGRADVGKPVDENTIYHWASITKTFTAIAIMQLRDRGLISLDDAIVDYVPELRDVHNEFGGMEEITLRQLLSHSAGFRGGTWPWGGGEEWHPHEPTEWSQLVAMIPYTQIHFQPGSRFSYSNPGIIFLGRVIEKVTGDVYEAYVDKNIFRPLGMRRAYFDVTPWHLLPYRSNHFFYYEGEETPIPGGLDFNTGITVSNGGLNAPLGDMARYLAFLMGSPMEDQRAEEVLTRSSLEEMWQAVVPVGDSNLGPERMGLSFFLYQRPEGRLVGHTGTQRAFYSFFYIDPEAKVGVLGAFNTAGVGGAEPDTNGLRLWARKAVVDRVFPHLGR